MLRIKLFGEEHENTADSYRTLGVTQQALHDYKAALQSHQHALAIRIKLFGEEHESTADSYYLLGVTTRNYIRVKLFGEEHESTADSL